MIPTEDLSMGRIEEEGIVYQVTVFGQTEFKASSKLPYDAKITIRYHVIKPVQVPVSSKNCKGANYSEVISEFEDAGFVNIQTETIYDIVAGWVNKDGEIKKVIVNGEEKFEEGATYRPDVEVIVIYHTYKKNNPDN